MADPFIGEIRMFAGGYAPDGWAFCNGQTMQIGENTTLYGLIKTTYGGDGQETFALPDLRDRTPVHQGAWGLGYALGQPGGAATVQLTQDQMPAHMHPMMATDQTLSWMPAGALPAATVFAEDNDARLYAPSPNTSLNPKSLDAVGGSGAHDNHQSFQCVNFIIALQGVFPPPQPPGG